MPRKIILIGFMGVGKSSLGLTLSKAFDIPFYDLDTEIEKETGKSISTLVAEHGMDFFRESEKKTLKELRLPSEYILAIGGGTPCFFDNMQTLKRLGSTIYLTASAEFLFSRLKNKKAKRPLIADKSDGELLDFIRELLDERRADYEQSEFHYSVKLNKQANKSELVGFVEQLVCG